jgi:hypothetical protein
MLTKGNVGEYEKSIILSQCAIAIVIQVDYRIGRCRTDFASDCPDLGQQQILFGATKQEPG